MKLNENSSKKSSPAIIIIGLVTICLIVITSAILSAFYKINHIYFVLCIFGMLIIQSIVIHRHYNKIKDKKAREEQQGKDNALFMKMYMIVTVGGVILLNVFLVYFFISVFME